MAKLYRIRDWEDLYENSRSRKVEDLRWVPIPNHHDGETFSLIMAHPDGAVIFSSWILLVQIASKCEPRGTLIRGNGEPHNAISLSAKCRAPATWFEIALNYLENNTDWLVVEEVTTERHSPTTQLAPSYQSSAEEWKEGKGREENAHAPDAHIPTLEEVIDRGSMIGTPEASCRKFFSHHQGQNLWMNQFGRLIDWPYKLKTWGENDRSNPRSGEKDWLNPDGTPKPGYLTNGLRYDLP